MKQNQADDLWDRSASAYNRFERRWQRYTNAARLLLDRFHLAKDAVVVDLACGTGASTLEAAKRAPKGRVLGVDASVAMLRFAHANAMRAGLSNVEFKSGDVHESLFRLTSRFDAAICNAAFWQFVNPRRVLQGVRRLLKPAGYFGCTLIPPLGPR